MDDINRQIDILVEEQSEMEEQAEIESEEITAIWMQIKATLAKVRIPIYYNNLHSCLIFLRL